MMNLIGTELRFAIVTVDKFGDDRGYFSPYFIENKIRKK